MSYSLTHVIILQALVLLACATLLWACAVLLGNVSIIDRFWSVFFIIATLAAWVLRGADVSKILVVIIPLLLWGIRLCLHITIRGYGKGEDPRYKKLKNTYGDFRSWSLWFVFWPQALLSLIIGWPLTLVVIHQTSAVSSGTVLLGLLLFVVGFLFEAVADFQLSRFQKTRQLPGHILDQGLWAWSRHPNYFGEAVLWWGFYVISVGVTGHFYSVFSPILMTYLLLRVSGVNMLEDMLKNSKPAYKDYIKKTSAFFPWPPKK